MVTLPLPIVKRYEPADRARVIRMLGTSEPWITLQYREAQWQRFFQAIESSDAREAFVITTPDDLVGAAVIRRHFLAGDYLELFVIDAAARRRGTGRALLAFVEARVFARTKNLFLCVTDFNEPARRFYRRAGYEDVGSLPNLLVAGHAEILMRKTTGPARS